MVTIDYSKFDLADFAADEYFVSWVIHPDEENEAFWSEWHMQNPDKKKMLHEARLVVLLMRSRRVRMHEDQKESLWQRIQAVTVEKGENLPQPQQIISDRNTGFPFYKIAASLALVLTATAAVYFFKFSSFDNKTVENPKGKKSVVYLEDGTKVWLNSDSRLSYAESFAGEENRTVELEGEAFFDVAEDPTKPFIVKTGDLEIRVLGTAFNVKAFKDDKQIETTLLRGKVEVGYGNKSDLTILSPDQQAVYQRDSDKISVSGVKAEKFASWKEGALVFDNTPFSEMEIALERWYGVEIILTDESGGNCRFSTEFQNEPISKVLELLKATSGIDYVISGNTITINGSLCRDLTNSI